MDGTRRSDLRRDRYPYYRNRDNSRKFSRWRGRQDNGYYDRRSYPATQYSSNSYNAKYSKKPDKKAPSRPASPVEGSEEYMARKIEHTSALIMRHLLSPNEIVASNSNVSMVNNTGSKINEDTSTKKDSSQSKRNLKDRSSNKTKTASLASLSAKEIHEKIINHITNLNEGRKKNFVNANSCTSLDNAIIDMQRRQRLEISRILRDMSFSSFEGQGGNQSIVPDIGIKIEELPFDIIEELKQTLHIDLELLNEAIDSDSCNKNVGKQGVPVEVEDVIIIDGEDEMSVQPKVMTHVETQEVMPIQREEATNVETDNVSIHPEGLQTSSSFDENLGLESIEIKTEDICDVFEERVDLSTTCLPQLLNKNQSPGVCIKEETEEEEPESSAASAVSSTTTIPFDIGKKLPVTQEQTSHCPPSNLKSKHSFSALQATIQEFIERDRANGVVDLNTLSSNIDSIDMCIKGLSDYRSLLTQSLVRACTPYSCRITNERSCGPQSAQTGNSEGGQLTKKQKTTNEEQSSQLAKLEEGVIKAEEPETPHIFNFPKKNEKIIALERVQNQLLVATEEGNIIFASLRNGNLSCLDVTHRPITSMAFVKGINDFIYMFVGSLEEVLRVYDFKRRIVLKACRIDDQIRCMDSMWGFVFMGCKMGTMIRYSCKKEKIEFQEKITGNDILVLKAAQEGPRRVLIIGHRQAPIFVRDAFSGLCLRNFSNEAIVPTVYSIVIHNSFLYCGTLKDNILVFAFHEGHLLEKIVAGESRGISCMKIYRNYLFAGCYNGSIYVYNLNHNKLVMTLEGPGGGILCIEVLSNQVIVGTLTNHLKSFVLPSDIFEW